VGRLLYSVFLHSNSHSLSFSLVLSLLSWCCPAVVLLSLAKSYCCCSALASSLTPMVVIIVMVITACTGSGSLVNGKQTIKWLQCSPSHSLLYCSPCPCNLSPSCSNDDFVFCCHCLLSYSLAFSLSHAPSISSDSLVCSQCCPVSLSSEWQLFFPVLVVMENYEMLWRGGLFSQVAKGALHALSPFLTLSLLLVVSRSLCFNCCGGMILLMVLSLSPICGGSTSE